MSSSRPVTFSPQRPIAAADAVVAEHLDRTCLVAIRAASGHLSEARFFTILHPAWFLSSCLNFAWFLGSSIVLLGSCLRCWSSDHHIAFIQVMFATYWTTKLTLANTLVQFGLVDHQIPKSKVNGSMVHFSYTCIDPAPRGRSSSRWEKNCTTSKLFSTIVNFWVVETTASRWRRSTAIAWDLTNTRSCWCLRV